ncbi:ketopantoate reductase family protein [Cryobacterium psychrophilum]|uniref:Ketopantoate reductase N-terminal domain-containing protein n=1 Tax=Cryobacterium psychrophilum TaxID=41988 RepID=A0A4Y8KS36_9MICO|nr:hypothetical protein E3T53_01185 [Cryobacterium psychrophilum]
MGPRIAILGPGAKGATTGADLVRASRDVTFIEQWPAHVEDIRDGGIAITCDGDTVAGRASVRHRDDARAIRCRARPDPGQGA